MTVSYSLDVANTRFLGFAKLLLRWKGSIYKILWREFFLFCLCYSTLSVTYRCFLNKTQKEVFEHVVIFVDVFTDFIPLSFVLGFYVTLVVGRWWAQYEAIPRPDRACFMISSFVHGSDERSRMIRRALGRYLILLQAITFQAVSPAVKKRFPTTQHLVAAGIMTKEEHTVYEKVSFPYGKWWLPCHWFFALATRAKREGRIKEPILFDSLLQELISYRNACGTMLAYDWISVPLVYTQVVTIATYLYAMALLIGRQYLDPKKGYTKYEADLYVPVFTLVQFFFYVGWLKVAEQILNPYGEDEDDYELNWCLDRSVHIVYLIVDQMHMKHPKVSRDHFWDDTEPKLPQTKTTAKFNLKPQLGSAHELEVNDVQYLPLDIFLEQDKEENMYCGSSVRNKGNDRLRSSFVNRVLNSRIGQSFRSRSTNRPQTRRSLSQPQGITNPCFVFDEKRLPSNNTTSSIKRKSSIKNSSTKNALANYETPNAVFYDKNQIHNRYTSKNETVLNAHFSNFSNSTETGFNHPNKATLSASNSLPMLPMPFYESNSTTQTFENVMPPIPEESSRCSSLVCADADVETSEVNPSNSSDLQNFVREANRILKEINRTVSNQGFKNDNSSKDYESCCSLCSTDSSSDEYSEEPVDGCRVNIEESNDCHKEKVTSSEM
ncbi:bestrophin-4-like [Uloborus diversus]|uniref:bestrophin-4-like n=1 Tax=Uloborus diversus TaxID=327109 RepID=UPI002409394E|nr:bestrophin-4-like [Uloborus diversus]